MTNQFQILLTAATAVVGYDCFQGEKFAQANYNRKLSEIAIVGSAAIADFGVEIWAGEARKGAFYNTTAGASLIPKDYDRKYPNALIPANAQLMCKVIDAALTNAVCIEVTFTTSRRRSTTFRSYGNSGFRPWRPSSRYPTRQAWMSATGRG